MKTILLAALLLTAAVALAQDQQQQKIDTVTDQDVITLDSGESYEALDPTVEYWQADDSVTVSDDNGTITNHDQDDDAADVIPDGDEN